jgi:hypothetical protein
MDMQTQFDLQVKAERKEQMKTSPQLTLGKIISLLEKIENQDNPVVITDNKNNKLDIPKKEIRHRQQNKIYIGSWRGSYSELSIGYDACVSNTSTKDFLLECKKAVGKVFIGYKGGNFRMGKKTPVWIDNYGHCIFLDGNNFRGVIDVRDEGKRTVIVWAPCPYL